MNDNLYKRVKSQTTEQTNFAHFHENSEKKSVSLSSWNLVEYITSLSDENVGVIFASTSCVIELYSSLSELQQLIISRLLILGENNSGTIAEKAINLWISPLKQNELILALKELRSLKIIKADLSSEIDQKKSVGTLTIQYSLNTTFQRTLTNYICNGSLEVQFCNMEINNKLKISYISLTKFSKIKWNNLLDIIVEFSGYNSLHKLENENTLKNYDVVSDDLLTVLYNINLISYNSQMDHQFSESNEKKGIRIKLDTAFKTTSEIYDGLDENDDIIFYQKQKQEFDTYNTIELLDLELENNSDDQEYLINSKTRKSCMKKQVTNTMKRQMDKIFEQKLAPKAFCWLLCDTRNQLLVLINGFIQILEKESVDIDSFSGKKENENNLINPKIADVISLIFRLSSSKVGQNIQLNYEPNKNHLLTRFILFAYDLGILYIDEESLMLYKANYRKNDRKILHINEVYTTPYSILLSSDGSKLQGLYPAFKLTTNNPQGYRDCSIKDLLLPSHFYYDEKHWFDLTNQQIKLEDQGSSDGKNYAQIEAGIIVQSNFRIYCYTASPLQAKILRHLCQVKVRGPNVITGVLTRKGLLSAYSMGVSAEQILRFFTSNAHPILLKRLLKYGTSLIPISVETQLKLWEKDKNRLEITPASVLSEWGISKSDIELYNQTLLYAKGRNIVLYSTETVKESNINNSELNELIIVIREEYEDDIKAFIRAKREMLKLELDK
ncbi:transcription factor TFIIH [Cryptosporidium ryanae]|uniref:transcription factor TFIIH n=1 Tax=Cryptosporidium ryanae TaxID=515981 RepID=UPI00351A41A2|nr:transcription factor TFIIH [Cryptosporidium ryanae]